MQLIPIRKKYKYERLERLDLESGRVYATEEGVQLPSVTTVLSGTKDQTFLKEWENSVGKDKAEQIKNEAATVGTHMHNVVERLLMNKPLPVPRTWLAVKGYRMGYALIEHFFPHVQEVWGAEVPLYYPERYAGTTDCVGIYKGEATILDFKQTNKPKKREWIDDYFLQLGAYAAAHNKVYGTDIRQGVIMMVCQDGTIQEFVTCGREFDGYQDQWMRRVEQYASQKRESDGVDTSDSKLRVEVP
jgi:genome maintenance exonuclease 1